MIFLAIPTVHNIFRYRLSYVAGTQLIILAILRLFTIFRYSGVGKDEGLLPQYDDSFDKYVVAKFLFFCAMLCYAFRLESRQALIFCNLKIHRIFLMNFRTRTLSKQNVINLFHSFDFSDQITCLKLSTMQCQNQDIV